jgi:glucans biosynthesis protein
MHGGAKGSGAPRGNRNAFRHGLYTQAAMAELKALRRMMAEAEGLLAEL